MDPYYQSERATLYLGDSREILPTLPRASVDLIATDPPYGVAFRSSMRPPAERFDAIVGDDGSLDVLDALAAAVLALRNCRHVYVFGYSPDDLRDPMKLGGTADLVWDKENTGMGDLSLPWAPAHERITFGVHVKSAANRERGDGALAARLRSASVLRVARPNSRGVSRHPTEKPVALMRRLIESSSSLGELVLDPFAGCGSTLVAAVLAGRRAVGIEVAEKYAEIAAKRLAEADALAALIAAV